MSSPTINQLMAEDEYTYNHKLAQVSLELAISAFSSEDSIMFWGENYNCGRENDIKNSLIDLGFKDLHFYNYDVSLNSNVSKAAFAAGIKEYSADTVIIAIVIRGGRYGLEWVDNFNIGSGDYDFHRGFYSSALDIKNKADKIISKYSKDYKIKLFISGYSRGGAIANILASLYDNEKDIKQYQVYAYTFASPKTVIIEKTKCHDDAYRNIFNILSPNDPVYNIPPLKWGFGRFGICVILPDNNLKNNSGDKATLELVYDDYYKRTGKTLVTSENTVNTLVDLIIKSSSGRDFFDINLSKPISDLIMLKMIRDKKSDGKWYKTSMENNILNMYGEEFVGELLKLKKNYLFVSLEKIGLNLPEEFYVFIALCMQNGYNGYENVLFSRLKLDELSGLSFLSSSDIKFIGHTTDFYLSWLYNVPVSELKYIME